MMTLETQCTNRKEMVQKISSFLNTPAVYLRTPTYAFQIGEITVNRDASVSGEPEQMMPVAQFLKDNGYIQELPAELIEQPADSDDKVLIDEQVDRISVSIPLADCTPTQLANVLRTIYARQTLIAAMTRCDYIRMDEEVITLLSEAQPEDMERISEILQSEATIGMLSGIAIEEGNLKMDTTYNRENPTGWNDFANLLLAMADKAMKAHHVSSKRIEPADDEMKYFCRSWLMQLGMGGAEFKSTRASLLNHLHGFAAFRTADKMNAHKAKYSEFRRELREERSREQNDA